MTRLVVAAAAAYVGFLIGGPAGALQGFTLGYGLSAGLDPNKKVLGSRLTDLRAPSATYGAPIAYIEGAPRLAGNFIWASTKREIATTTTEGGKGGPGVDSTTFTYEMDVGILLSINEADALRRVWSNGKLVWSNADDSDGATVIASSLTTSWRDIRFYSGAADQLPDPTYEAMVGIGNAPAYRGRAHVVVEGLNLGNSGQLPVLTFEVVTEAGISYASTRFADFVIDPSLLSPGFIGGISAMDPQGFDFLYGGGYDGFNGGHTHYTVRHVDLSGAITEGATFQYSSSVGMGTGKEGNGLQGNSDVSVLVVNSYDPAFSPTLDHFTIYKADGSSVSCSYGVTTDHDAPAFSMRADRIAIACTTTAGGGGSLTVRIYDSDSGAHMATSPAMAQEMQFCAIGDGVVYANDSSGNHIYVISLVDGSLTTTIATPYALAVQAGLACDEDGNLYHFGIGPVGDAFPIYRWDGLAWLKVANDANMYATPSERHAYYAERGVLAVEKYVTAGLVTPEEQFYISVNKVAIVPPTLDQVVRRLCLRTGLLTDVDIDVTDLSHDVAIADGLVYALAISQPGPVRTTLEMLMAAYLFEASEGDTLRFVRRGAAATVTIPFDHMGASTDGTAEPLPLKRVNDIETAARVSVKYANILNDFQDGLEAADRLVTESTAEQVVELPLGLMPSDAKKLADANTLDLAIGLNQIGPVALSRAYSALEPCDVLNLTDIYGDTFRARIARATIGGGILSFELVLDDATVINSAAQTDDDYTSSTLVRLASTTSMLVLDIAILRDADNALGPYLAVTAGSAWSGAKAYRSIDDTIYDELATFTAKTVLGVTTSVLGSYTGTGFDELNSVTVNVGEGVLSSFTRDDVLAGTADAYVIGTEILYACNATLITAGNYKLSKLLRGQRGTEQNLAGHVGGEKVVLLQQSGSGLRKTTDTLPDLNVARYYKAVTIGRSIADVAGDPFTDTGIALKPFAVTDMRVDYTDPANPVLSWKRRSRLASSLFGMTLPLGEDLERYEIEVYNGSNVLQYSGSALTPAFTLTPPTTGQHATVWQISATVGRGYPSTLVF
jgi:hypothetical protein